MSSRWAKRAIASNSKFNFFDTGIYNTLRPSEPFDIPEEKSGAALEGLIAQHLRSWIDYFHPDAKPYYWRTLSGNEIDFVVYGQNIFYAIEVKNTATIHPQILRPLKII